MKSTGVGGAVFGYGGMQGLGVGECLGVLCFSFLALTGSRCPGSQVKTPVYCGGPPPPPTHTHTYTEGMPAEDYVVSHTQVVSLGFPPAVKAGPRWLKHFRKHMQEAAQITVKLTRR